MPVINFKGFLLNAYIEMGGKIPLGFDLILFHGTATIFSFETSVKEKKSDCKHRCCWFDCP